MLVVELSGNAGHHHPLTVAGEPASLQ